jgi:hypothetical protein
MNHATEDSGQELAEIGRSAEELRGDDRLFQAIVNGAHVASAAEAAGMSERTAYRRLADTEFRDRLHSARENLRESILAKLADAGHDAVGTLWDLMHTAEDENVKMRSAKALLDSLATFHERCPKVETTTTVTRKQRIIE